MTEAEPIVVVKVGGSLFDLPDLRLRLTEVLNKLGDVRMCLVSGGGAVADVVRDLQKTHDLTDTASHHIAMESLKIGEQLLCELVPGAVVCSGLVDLEQAWNANAVAVVQAASFVANECQHQPRLREDWSVTSDSIAAWIASAMDAGQLLLLKSTPAEPRTDLIALNKVDAGFEDYARGIPELTWCNLRDDCELTSLRTGPAA